MEMGMREMREDAIKKALLGVTTLEEALNTTQLD
jgi:type II secretory ATPase GspE/PulE/Tfp pilus assembly ATPase PilB-like protein